MSNKDKRHRSNNNVNPYGDAQVLRNEDKEKRIGKSHKRDKDLTVSNNKERRDDEKVRDSKSSKSRNNENEHDDKKSKHREKSRESKDNNKQSTDDREKEKEPRKHRRESGDVVISKEHKKRIKEVSDDSKDKRREDKEKRHRNESDKMHRDEKDKKHQVEKEKRNRDEKEKKHQDEKEKRKRDEKEKKHHDEKERRNRDDREKKHSNDKKESRHKTSEPESSSKHKERKSKEKVIETVYDDYEDDFEAYDDDFEDSFEESDNAIVNNEEEENESVSSEDSYHQNTRKDIKTSNIEPSIQIKSKVNDKLESEISPKKAASVVHNSFINFQFAQRRVTNNAKANKMLDRAYDLCKLIEFDRVQFEIFEVCPVLDHDQYMERMLGRNAAQNMASQTGSDNLSRDIQTDDIETRLVWTQFPALDDVGDFGVIAHYDGSNMNKTNPPKIVTDSKSQQKSVFLWDELYEEQRESSNSTIVVKLAKNFLDILKEDEILNNQFSVGDGQNIWDSTNRQDLPKFSAGIVTYQYKQKYQALLACFSTYNTDLFAVVYQKRAKKSKDNGVSSSARQCICIWNIREPTRKPQMELDSPGEVSALTFSPSNLPSHLIAGLDSGVLLLYNLSSCSLVPDYITATQAVSSTTSTSYHLNPIVSIYCVSNSEDASSSFYKLLSIDSIGLLCTWIVSLDNQAGLTNPSNNRDVHSFSSLFNMESGSITDLLLRPGANSNISFLSSIYLNPPNSSFITATAFNPTHDESMVFVGTSSGHMIQQLRGSNDSSSSSHSSSRKKHTTTLNGWTTDSSADEDSGPFSIGAVTCMDLYPFDDNFVLAGYDDGCLRVYRTHINRYTSSSSSTPSILTFSHPPKESQEMEPNGPILCCRWSRSRPAILYSLDSNNIMCIWSLLTDKSAEQQLSHDQLPALIIKHTFLSQQQLCIGLDLSIDFNWLIPTNQKSTKSTYQKMQTPRLMCWFLNGEVIVHELSEEFSVCKELDESFHVSTLLHSLS